MRTIYQEISSARFSVAYWGIPNTGLFQLNGKRLRLLFICLFFIAFIRTGNAIEVQTVFHGIAHDALYAIDFQDKYGISVGANGLILESKDGGNTWEQHLPSLTEKAITDVSLGTNKGVMVGQQGLTLVKEGDDKWHVIESVTDNRLLAVDLQESGVAVAVGGFGTVLLSNDFGNSWKPVDVDWEAMLDDFIEPHLYDVHISSNGHIYIVGEFGLVLRSIDVGQNWEVLHKGESSLFALSMLDSGEVIAVGQNGTVLKSMHPETDWQTLSTGTRENLLGVWHNPQGEIVINGIRTMMHSSDYGLSWQKVEADDISVGWYQGLAVSSMNKTEEKGLSLNNLFSVGNIGKINKFYLGSD